MAPRTATANRKWVTCPRLEQTLVLESLERGIHCANGIIAADARGELSANREPVCVVLEVRDRQQGGELELSN
jgi:hypothetical protein